MRNSQTLKVTCETFANFACFLNFQRSLSVHPQS